jgi:hypothetical protein
MPAILDQPFIDHAIEQFSTLEPDATPEWGELSGSGVVEHLIGSFRYALGELGNNGFQGDWKSKHILWPLLRFRLVSVPKNVKFKDKKGDQAPAVSSEGDVEKLRAIMESSLTGLVENPDMPPHPFFGDFGPKGWSEFHVIHTKHHLKQFGLKT